MIIIKGQKLTPKTEFHIDDLVFTMLVYYKHVNEHEFFDLEGHDAFGKQKVFC